MKPARKLINLTAAHTGLICAGPAPINLSVENPPHPDRPYFARAAGRAFDVRAAADVTEIEIYDEIGFWGITASAFHNRLKNIVTDTIRLKINSPGGDVFDGIAMYNDLVAHPARIEVEVTGIAASMASVIAMAGDQISLADNAFLMIHNAWTVAAGDKQTFAETVAILDKIDGALVATYAARTGLDEDVIAALMDAETWLSAEEAEGQGFADGVIGLHDVSAHFDLSTFNNVPDELKNISLNSTPTKRDCERALRDAGASKKTACGMLAGGYDAVCSQRDADDDETALIAAMQRLNENMQIRS